MAPNCTATIAARMSVGRVPDRSRSKANANWDGSAQVCAQGIMTELGYRRPPTMRSTATSSRSVAARRP